MEHRKSKTRIQIPVFFFVFALLKFWSVTAQNLYQYNHRTSTQTLAANSQVATQSSPSNTSNSISTGSKDHLVKRFGKRRAKVNREKIEFLNAHNLIRRRVGEPLFSWDGRLAAYARAWAKKRVDDCRLVHSDGPYGENIFWGGRSHWRPREAVEKWAEEDRYYDRRANTCQPRRMCGHFTQIVWRKSTKVGCARALCSNGSVYIICVYNPPGNYEGENPFGEYNYKDQTGVERSEPPATAVADPPYYAAANGPRRWT